MPSPTRPPIRVAIVAQGHIAGSPESYASLADSIQVLLDQEPGRDEQSQTVPGEKYFVASVFENVEDALGFVDEPGGTLVFLSVSFWSLAQKLAAQHTNVRFRVFSASPNTFKGQAILIPKSWMNGGNISHMML